MALVDDLGWDRFVLLGHSMGGMVSQAIAVHHPEPARRARAHGHHPGPRVGERR